MNLLRAISILVCALVCASASCADANTADEGDPCRNWDVINCDLPWLDHWTLAAFGSSTASDISWRSASIAPLGAHSDAAGVTVVSAPSTGPSESEKYAIAVIAAALISLLFSVSEYGAEPAFKRQPPAPIPRDSHSPWPLHFAASRIDRAALLCVALVLLRTAVGEDKPE